MKKLRPRVRALKLAKEVRKRLMRELNQPIKVILFGSQARGDALKDSDLDLLIDVVPDCRFSILNLVKVEHLVGEIMGITANAFMRRSLDKPFKTAIAADVIEVF